MDPQSPPKRMTRARAAKAGGSESSGPKTTKIMTAAAKAKAAPTATRTTSTATKRKTPSDEEDEEDEINTEKPVTRATRPRGRPKKVVEEADDAPSTSFAPGRATRARAAARKVPAEASNPEPEAAVAKPTRGRPRKVVKPEEESSEPPKKTTRARAATVTSKTAATKPAVKKRVTFEEPEKENVVPDNGKENEKGTTGGLRGRPVRKAGAVRATRTTSDKSASESTKQKKTPLSPKKITQMPHAQDESEDELTATDKKPAPATTKPLKKSPVKPPSRALNGTPLKKTAPPPAEEPEIAPEEVEVEDEEKNHESSAGSPARRPPASPFKDSMRSPAKRFDPASLPKSASGENGNNATEGQSSPFKPSASLLTSPAKRPQSPIKGLSLPSASQLGGSESTSSSSSSKTRSPKKASFLQSPAKRSAAPLKVMPALKPAEPVNLDPINNNAGDDKSISILPDTQPTMSMPLRMSSGSPGLQPMKSSAKLMMEEDEAMQNGEDEDDLPLEDISTLQFPGRLSAVLPRFADPALKDNMAILHENASREGSEPLSPASETEAQQVEVAEDTVQTNESQPSSEIADSAKPSPAPRQSPKKQPAGAFGLREHELDPYDGLESESEDDMTCPVPATPTPGTASRRRSLAPQSAKHGFTPLAQRFGAWAAASPIKSAQPVDAQADDTTRVEDVTVKSTFFEDEMTVRSQFVMQVEGSSAPQDELMAGVEEPEFDGIPVTNEDLDLAAEADEMSILDGSHVPEPVPSNSFDDCLSEASQEYGDENQIPIDPAMYNNDQNLAGPSVPPTTPNRMLTKEFHTVSKVPLKGADTSTPRPKKKKRAASISRLPVSRPTNGLTRSATVISYSPTKKDNQEVASDFEVHVDSEPQRSAPATPAKSEAWSVSGTPARTPRRDLNTQLLNGVVAFVDVYTSEGADASGIFVELLTQMGARCVKHWGWNPDSSWGTESSKIGITHVVYKDGSKRTMEKVRESRGLVQCVGVSWVLDCERRNKWLEETSYYIDSSTVTGSRRRKSMEPQALTNMNGTLVPTPVKNSNGRDTATAPNTPMNRRDSTLWMISPKEPAEEDDADGEMDDYDWEALLSPVPKTPAPEALARYATDVTPETPTAAFGFDGEGGDFYSPSQPNAGALMQTCPPKASTFSEMGSGILDRQKDEGVLQRLMAARRKSLQFAPKVGSPLSKAWK